MATNLHDLFEPVDFNDLLMDDYFTSSSTMAALPHVGKNEEDLRNMFGPVDDVLDEFMENTPSSSGIRAGIAAGEWVESAVSEKWAALSPAVQTYVWPIAAASAGFIALSYGRRTSRKGRSFWTAFGLRLLLAASAQRSTQVSA